ncbi:MAG: HAD family hydrolase [Betaproteobacteria bacterium]|nr:HAD family hydrolase [Betaproteobacteria bacterium]
MSYRAVLWDFGGVITTSPFEAFSRFERERNLPEGLLRRINSTNPGDNAWARFERGELSHAQFDDAFGEEALALGYRVRGAQVAQLLHGEIRPQMVEALKHLRGRFRTACVTNNFSANMPVREERAREIERVMGLFDLVIESSKVGVRKPELRFYELAIAAVDVPARGIVYLDDLGINLKPARALGMTTIKVTDPDSALAELETVLGIGLTK